MEGKIRKCPQHIISIIGMIGSGKTTMLRTLKSLYLNNDKIRFVEEPIHKWTLLSKFYHAMDNQSLYDADEISLICFNFQLEVLSSYREIYEDFANSDDEILVLDSNSYVAFYVYSQMLKTNELLSKEHYTKLGQYFHDDILEKHQYIFGMKTYLLNTDVNDCLFSIKERNRAFENKIDKTYLKETGHLMETQYPHQLIKVKRDEYKIIKDEIDKKLKFNENKIKDYDKNMKQIFKVNELLTM
jgi:deoxyadenosine/deoxycytidine kinase